MTLLIALVIAYLIGSLPTAVIVCRLTGLPDPRNEGSGNPGTTNVLRIGGKKPAIIVLVFDVLKGMIPIIIAKFLGLSFFAIGLTALAAILGHIFSVFSHFQGGKGIATSAGALLMLSPLLGFAVITTWIIVACITRYSSLAALIAAALAPIYGLWLANPQLLIPIILITMIIFWKHANNIQNLIAGTESKINFGNS